MKNKYRIIQIVLILLIFIVLGFYWTEASAEYEIRSSSSDIITSNKIDTIKMSAFDKKDTAIVHYSLYKGNDEIHDANLDIKLFDKDGLEINGAPSTRQLNYIEIIESGYNKEKFDIVIYLDKYYEYSKTQGLEESSEMLNEFKVQFLIYSKDPQKEDEFETLVLDERILKIETVKNTETEKAISEFLMVPYFMEENNAFSDFKITKEDDKEVYYLNINMGKSESIKNYIFDVSMLNSSFPKKDILNISVNSITKNKIEDSENIDIFLANNITNSNGEIVSLNSSKNRLIVKAQRTDDLSVNTKEIVEITFSSIYGDSKTIEFVINLNAYEKSGNRLNAYEAYNKSKNIYTDDLNIKMIFEFIPTNILVRDEDNQILDSSLFNAELPEGDPEDFEDIERFSSNISLSKTLTSGFYTIESYVNDTLSTLNTFYVNNLSDFEDNLFIIDKGKHLDYSKNEINLKIPNSRNGKKYLFIDGSIYNGDDLIGNEFSYSIEFDEEISESNSGIILNEDYRYLEISGESPLDYFYLNIFSNNLSGYNKKIKVNLDYVSLIKYDLSFYIDAYSYEIPVLSEYNEYKITPTIVEYGKINNDANYSYEIFFKDSPLTNNSVFVEKREDGDFLKISDVAQSGDYVVKLFIVGETEHFFNEYISIGFTDFEEDIYKLVINNDNKIAVPSTAKKVNKVIIDYEVIKNGNLIEDPDVVFSLDEKMLGVNLRDNTIEIRSKATVGETFILNLLHVDSGVEISKEFTLVEQDENNDSDIIDDDNDDDGDGIPNDEDDDDDNDGIPDDDDDKDDNSNDDDDKDKDDEDDKDDNNNDDDDKDKDDEDDKDDDDKDDNDNDKDEDDGIYPFDIKLTGDFDEKTKSILFEKSSGTYKTLKYSFHDEFGAQVEISNVSIYLKEEIKGIKLDVDYSRKEIDVYANGLYNNKQIIIVFAKNGHILNEFSMKLLKPSYYDYSFGFIQRTLIRGNNIQVDGVFKNNDISNEQEVVLALICYDENGKIVARQTVSSEIKKGKENKFSTKIQLPYKIDNVIVKGFLLKGTELKNVIAIYSNPRVMTNRDIDLAYKIVPFSPLRPKIEDVSIRVNKEGIVSLVGSTQGYADNMNLLVKVFDDKNNLQYFNQINVNGNVFEDMFVPSDVKENSNLTLEISGDLNYIKDFYYSSQYESNEEIRETNVLELLKNYKIYNDNNSNYKLKFNINFLEDLKYGYIYLNSTNFIISDSLWKNKDNETWESYLYTISKKVKEIINKDVFIYIYDKNGAFLGNYPKGGIVEDYVLTNQALQKTLSGYGLFSTKENNFYFNFLLEKATSKYVKIKALGNFSKNDNGWKKVNYNDLEKYANLLAKTINKYYNCDIDIGFYDKDDKYLGSYAYYYYIDESEDENLPFEYIPWDNSKATDLVLMLELTNYGKNSKIIKPMINEGMVSSKYQYTFTLNNFGEINNAINDLRNDSQKIIVVKENVDNNNIKFIVPSTIVRVLKENNVLLIFDCNNFRAEFDFSEFIGSGEIVLNTTETSLEIADSYSIPINIEITANKKDAKNLFNNGIKCLIHYISEKTREIKDLRSINVFDNNNNMLNSTSTTLEKGFIFKYNGKDIYYAKANQYTFTDIEDIMLKQYAQLIASKKIIPIEVGNNIFNPDKEITKGEFISYISNKLGAKSDKSYFKDMKPDYKYFKEVNGVYELGVLPPIYDEKTDFNEKINKQDMIYMVIRCYEVNDKNDNNIKSASLLYRDKSEIDVWARVKTSIASKLKIIPDDGYLEPKSSGTKLFAAELFYKLLRTEKIF